MKRYALLICNNTASGATHDIIKWQKFLDSTSGGAWRADEIEPKVNPSLIEVRNVIQVTKLMEYDFVIVVYAGHGAWKRTTSLELNPQGEIIQESEFFNLAPREIICLDCCRGVSPLTEMVDEAQERMFSASQRDTIRDMYDRRMMEAYPQQVNLYACQIGESAYGDSNGGFYTNNLLDQATNFLPNSTFQTVNCAHNMAAPLTTAETWSKVGKDQHPDMLDARCMTNKQLIIGISNKMFRVF